MAKRARRSTPGPAATHLPSSATSTGDHVIARAADDKNLVAELLYERAWVLLRQGHQDAAVPLIDSGLGLAGRLGEPHLTGRLLSAGVLRHLRCGDDAGAGREAAESLRLFRQAGDRLRVGHMLCDLGYLELSAGDVDAAAT